MNRNLAESAQTGTELAQLTEAAIGALLDQPGVGELADAVLAMPPRVMAAQLREALQQEGLAASDAAQVAATVTRGELAPDVARIVLSTVSASEPLADEIADNFERRRELMAVDPLTIGAAALLLLVLRLRRVRVSKDGGVEIDLAPLKVDVVQSILGFVRGVG